MTRMDRCENIQELLADYRSGVLSEKDARKIEEHFSKCSECTAELEALDDVLELVECNAPEYEPPVGLWNGVHNRITSPEPKRKAFGRKIRQWISVPVRAAGVGVAALALAVGLMMGGSHHDPTLPLSTSANSEYIQGHALYASQTPLADQAAYISVADMTNTRQGDTQ